MRGDSARVQERLGLRAGDLVEVRSKEEIFASLDEIGCLDGLPFMPEMLPYCGRTLRVRKAAHKTCNTISPMSSPSLRLRDAVHLGDVRCEGEAHGGCQATCLMFWKEAWLKRVPDDRRPPRTFLSNLPLVWGSGNTRPARDVCDDAALEAATRQSVPGEEPVRYRCQITELERATEPLPFWDFRQFYRDLASGNVKLPEFLTTVLFNLFRVTLRLGAHRLQLGIYNRIQEMRGKTRYPFAEGTLDKTPTKRLGLQAGAEVETKSHAEIVETLDKGNRNRGLFFDAEMVQFCEKRLVVGKRVERILNEATGEMLNFSNPCLILEGAHCSGKYSGPRRCFCPRAIPGYWREIWVRESHGG